MSFWKWTTTLLLAIACVHGCKEPRDARALPGPETRSETPALGAPVHRWIVMEDHLWIPTRNELDRHLSAAEQSLTAGDQGGAASRLRHAAALLQQQADAADETHRPGLAQAASQLQGIAARLDRGETLTPDQYTPALEKARDVNMMEHWVHVEGQTKMPFTYDLDAIFAGAREALNNGDSAKAAKALRRAAALLELEVPTAHARTQVALRGAADDLRTLSTKLSAGETIRDQALEDAIKYASSSLEVHDVDLSMAGEQLASAAATDRATHYAIVRLEYTTSPDKLEFGDEPGSSVGQTQSIAQQMMTGRPALGPELEDVMQRMEAQLESIGERIP